MKRIDTPHSVPDLNGPGKPGFVDLNVATGVQGTEVSAAWLNMLQEELAGAVEAAGLALNGADSGQLRQAIQLLTVPAGTVQFFAMQVAPRGWLRANGAAVSRTTYPALFAAIGTTFGVGDGVSTFNLPDLSGQFVRGWTGAGALDPGRAFGSVQNDLVKLTDIWTAYWQGAAAPPIGNSFPVVSNQSSASNASYQNAPASPNAETRPKNIALLACVKV
ncbi:phage tail protein [Chromobacterium haemolyticum]|uniref:Phage tail protein n=1 Tax=Chromobacterium fluminis TaxID=3044269 RepID=A0ABX0LGE1_9NEIS|nr:phage tail protein [Chromobacterium haemolyticum]NHR07998.1 phage tail protein [Chromobacterium haemolyticum]